MYCMLPICLLLALLSCGALAQPPEPAAVPAQPAAAPQLETVPALSDEVLLNPRMGLYLQYPPLTAKADDWFMKIAGVAYYRLDWSTLNPEEGVYKFDEFFAPIFDFWVKQHHKRVAFRVMCQSMHSRSKYVTPQWVFDKGVPGVEHVGLYTPLQIDPVFWDKSYLDIHCEFIRKLGEYLDGREGLEFVDIGSIGEWGEMHLMRWTPQQLRETGFTHTRYVEAYRRVIDAFHDAFPKTAIFLNVGGQSNHTINDYAAIRGMHFRQDGLTPTGASYDVGGWLYGPYSRRGVMCNFEFHSGLEEMKRKNWDLKQTLDKGLSAPISYLNTNLGNYYNLPQEARDLLTDAARRIGYRFVVTKVTTNPQVRVDGEHPARLLIGSTWRNDGVAPCYDSYAVRWTVLDQKGAVVAEETTYPPVPTTQWWPGEEQQFGALVRIPGDTAPGLLRLMVAMIDPRSGANILLGIAGRDADDRYALCEVPAVQATPIAGAVYEEGFEAGAKPWSAVKGMTATVDEGTAHSGAGSLLVTGGCDNTWNYASVRLPAPAVPGGLYRLGVWMRVDKMDPMGRAPYVKLAVNAPDGKWLSNYGSNPYDLKQMGTWQYLETTADLPANAGSLDIAIERGAVNMALSEIVLRLDDVKVELLESP
jgi:hypothetical protein